MLLDGRAAVARLSLRRVQRGEVRVEGLEARTDEHSGSSIGSPSLVMQAGSRRSLGAFPQALEKNIDQRAEISDFTLF